MGNTNWLKKATGNANVKSFIFVFSVILYVVILTAIYQSCSTFLAAYTLILTLISVILYIIATKNKYAKEKAFAILDSSEAIRISKLLQYATAVLSFISLMTTAKGLQSFVFSEHEAWMAYLASFAVQAILVCFSLTFCHIYSAIRSINTLSDRGKTLATGALTLFLAASFVVSSSFSFSYIANNAYILLGANDSEIMIERYLTQRITDLESENKRIGSQLYDYIRNRNQDLTETIENFTQEEDRKLKNLVENSCLSTYEFQGGGTKYDFGLTDEVVDGWKRIYPSRTADIDGLVLWFDNYANALKNYCDDYNSIRQDFDKEKLPDENNWSSTELAIQNAVDSLTGLSQNLDSLHTQCSNIRIFVINYDIAPYRGALVGEVDNLKTRVTNQINYLNNLKEKVELAANGYSEDGKGTSLSDQIKAIQKEIYMLNTADMAVESQVFQQDIRSIIGQLSDILAAYSNDDVLDSDSIADILQLEELVAEYGAYINLAHDIDKYVNQNLSKTYNIIAESEDETSDEPSNKSPSGEGTVDTVTYEQWVSRRDGDFLKFFSLLKNLPGMPGFSETTVGVEGITEEHSLDKDDITAQAFTPADILYEANILRRDLLGQTTDFERAFNYFKYDFKAMAFFSAFIAAFFDLGAFLTGCFLYVMRHFARKGQSNISDGRASNPKTVNKSGRIP